MKNGYTPHQVINKVWEVVVPLHQSGVMGGICRRKVPGDVSKQDKAVAGRPGAAEVSSLILKAPGKSDATG